MQSHPEGPCCVQRRQLCSSHHRHQCQTIHRSPTNRLCQVHDGNSLSTCVVSFMRHSSAWYSLLTGCSTKDRHRHRHSDSSSQAPRRRHARRSSSHQQRDRAYLRHRLLRHLALQLRMFMLGLYSRDDHRSHTDIDRYRHLDGVAIPTIRHPRLRLPGAPGV